ncbi:MAG: hypothetical protein II038_06500 [Lachnospiraceae bacterium]|nr:hypothetical protein [Lachnospiraceae bacterium]
MFEKNRERILQTYHRVVDEFCGKAYSPPEAEVSYGKRKPLTYISETSTGGCVFISCDILSYPSQEAVAAILHAIILAEGRKAGVAITSRNGDYRNQQYKILATAIEVPCTYSGKNGWYPDTKDKGFIQRARKCFVAIDPKEIPQINIKKESVSSSSRTYICPQCGQSVRATKTVNILCGDCFERMVEKETYRKELVQDVINILAAASKS